MDYSFKDCIERSYLFLKTCEVDSELMISDKEPTKMFENVELW